MGNCISKDPTTQAATTKDPSQPPEEAKKAVNKAAKKPDNTNKNKDKKTATSPGLRGTAGKKGKDDGVPPEYKTAIPSKWTAAGAGTPLLCRV